jgi:Fe2+ or Zn2+ uptake regulation protein
MSPNEILAVSPSEITHAEEFFHQQLRRVGMHFSKRRRVVVRAFLRAPGPVSAHDLLYLVKKEDVFIAFGTVYRTLKTIVACGLGREVASPDGVTRYEHEHSRCLHRHLVCKDCGAVIEEQKES